ncbi:MAG: hypothetical protein ACR2K0_08125 [Acidimicrobiales bacterium]
MTSGPGSSGPGSEGGARPQPFSLGSVPPRLAVALALVGAGAVVVVAVLVGMATVPADVATRLDVGILQRVQLGARFVDLGVVVAVSVAVLLAGLVEPGATTPASEQATRTVLSGASAIGAALGLLVFLRLVADLAGGALAGPSRAGAVVYDLACLLVAGAGASWAYQELQRRRPESSVAAPPVPPPSAPGFPLGPPPAPGPPGPAAPHR